jgi:hypothetical protein
MEGTGQGGYTSSITGLTRHTTYHVRAYATNEIGTSYGSDQTFITTYDVPIVYTKSNFTHYSSTAWQGGGTIADEGGTPVTERGVCWSTSVNPTIMDNKVNVIVSGTGSFFAILDGLSPNTTYHARAYGTSSFATGYGEDVVFTTDPLRPIVITSAVSSATQTTINCGGNVIDDQGANVTSRGVWWSANAYPMVDGNTTEDGTGTGIFSSTITGLNPGTSYHVRAYATNSVGISYGGDSLFTTLPGPPSVLTNEVTSVFQTNVTTGGNVILENGAMVTNRGVCWSLSEEPTIADSKTDDGTGIGIFSSNITSLAAGTTYHLRAYATNIAGTAYGNERTFTTSPVAPAITTLAVTAIQGNTATSGGNITANGGAEITARGVCWSSRTSPTISSSKTSDGIGLGSYTSIMTGLASGATYYVRAYAMNSAGVNYGNEQTFIMPLGDTTSMWQTNGTDVYYNKSGKVGIGTANPTATLTVNGNILAKEVETRSEITSDYVFEPGYQLMPLPSLRRYITANKHLPEVPSVQDFSENGQNLSQTDDLLLRKLEQLSLYIIQQEAAIQKLMKDNEALKQRIENLEKTK